MALLSALASFNATHDVFSDVSANEVTGAGYTAGGQTIANKAVTTDDSGSLGVFDADDLTWPSSTITARYAAVYDETAGNRLICLIDFGESYASSNDNFTIRWNAAGIVNLS